MKEKGRKHAVKEKKKYQTKVQFDLFRDDESRRLKKMKKLIHEVLEVFFN